MKTITQMILSFTLLPLVACGGDGDDIIVERNTQKPSATVVNNNRNTTGPKAAQTRYEFPKLKEGYSEVIVHECTLNNKTGEAGVNYSLEWDHHRRATRWVCYQIYASISQSNYSRPAEDPWAYDPKVPEDEQQATYNELSKSYFPSTGSFYEKGHIVASADRLCTREANYQTFYMTNIYPMVHNFNGGIWATMEKRVRIWGGQADTLYVCKGGTIDKADGILNYTKGNHIVPKYFYMAVLSKKGSQWEAMAFWIEHQDVTSWKALQEYAISIDALESKTGLDFFCNLPDDIENKAESTLTLSYWNLK